MYFLRTVVVVTVNAFSRLRGVGARGSFHVVAASRMPAAGETVRAIQLAIYNAHRHILPRIALGNV